MDSDQLKLFLAICDEGSFSAAARKLRTSQSQVSVQIKKLEDGLGAQLFDRSHRSAELTPLGIGLRPEARRIVLALDTAMVSLRDQAAGRAGLLRIGIEDGARSDAVTKSLRRFCRRFRGARLDLKVLADGLRIGEFGNDDVRIVCAGEGPSAEGYREIESREVGMALPRKHRLVGNERLGGEDLLGEAILAGSAASPTALDQIVKSLEVGGGFEFDRSRERSLEERLWLVSLGLGVTACAAEEVKRSGYRVEWRPVGAAPLACRTLVAANPSSQAALSPSFVDFVTAGRN